MSNEDALENIKARLDQHIQKFSARRTRDKRKAFGFKLLALSLTLLATLSLGIKWSTDLADIAKEVAFVATALVTFFTGIDLFYNHKGLWIQYTATRNELYKIKDDLDYYVEKVGPQKVREANLDQYQARIQKTLDECNSWWVGERTKDGT